MGVGTENPLMRVVILDTDDRACEWLASVLNSQARVEWIEQVTVVEQAVEKARSCDLALVSTMLPNDGAFIFVQTLWRQEICTPVLVIGHGENKAEIVRLIEGGARGYMRREQVGGELRKHIQGALRGEAYISPEIAGALAQRLAELREWFEQAFPPAMPTDALTRREREILQLLGADYSNQDIADDLIIEVGTVKNHVHNILSKLNVSSRREAASYARVIKSRSRVDRKPGWRDQKQKSLYP